MGSLDGRVHTVGNPGASRAGFSASSHAGFTSAGFSSGGTAAQPVSPAASTHPLRTAHRMARPLAPGPSLVRPAAMPTDGVGCQAKSADRRGPGKLGNVVR